MTNQKALYVYCNRQQGRNQIRILLPDNSPQERSDIMSVITEREKQGFSKYLYSIGFNTVGVQETLQRIKENRADREDNMYYRRYLETVRR